MKHFPQFVEKDNKLIIFANLHQNLLWMEYLFWLNCTIWATFHWTIVNSRYYKLWFVLVKTGPWKCYIASFFIFIFASLKKVKKAPLLTMKSECECWISNFWLWYGGSLKSVWNLHESSSPFLIFSKFNKY